MARDVAKPDPQDKALSQSLRLAVHRFADLLPLLVLSRSRKTDMLLLALDLRHHVDVMIDHAMMGEGWKTHADAILAGTSRLHALLDRLSARAFMARVEPGDFDDVAFAQTLLKTPKADIARRLGAAADGEPDGTAALIVALAADAGSEGIQFDAEQIKQVMLRILTLLEGIPDERYRRWVMILARLLRTIDQKIRTRQADGGALDLEKRDCFVQVYVTDARATGTQVGVDWTLEFIVDGRSFPVQRVLNAVPHPSGHHTFNDLPIIVGDPFPKGRCGEEVTVSVKMRATERDVGQDDVGESQARDFTRTCPNVLWGRTLSATVTEGSNSVTIDADVMIAWMCAGEEFPMPRGEDF